jgi:hypothetical protein
MLKNCDVKNVALGTDGIGVNMFEEVKCRILTTIDTGGAIGPGIIALLQNGNTAFGTLLWRKIRHSCEARIQGPPHDLRL